MNLSKEEIKKIVKEVSENPNTKLHSAVCAAYRHIDDHSKLSKDQFQLILGAAETCDAWFDQRKLATEKLGPVFMDAVKGYLRTSKNGGMKTKEADMVEAVMEDFVRIGCLSQVVHPFIEKLVEDRIAGNSK